MRKKCVLWAKPVLTFAIATAAVVAAHSNGTSAQTFDPATLPRLEFSNLFYAGGFRLPAESLNGDSFSIGGRSMTFNPAGHSLFVSSRAGKVAEVSIPTPVNTSNVNAMPFARYTQGFFDPTEGNLPQVSTDGVNLEGLMVYGGRLYGTASIYYDAQNTQRLSHFSRSLKLDEPSFSGWSRVWEVNKTGYVAGAMSPIPAEWQARLGGQAATGQCCIPIVGRTSWGPSAFAFDPAMVGQATVTAAPLLYYTGEHPTLGAWDGSNPTYGATIQMGGMVMIAGTRTALYIGRNGTGPNCYGNGTKTQSLHGTVGSDGALWCYDPTSNDKGSHAYPYRYQIWAYDLNDFAAVKAGTKQPWDVVPYGVWPFDLPTAESTVRVGGIGYDAATQTLYLSQMGADQDGYSYRPIIHVVQIAGTTPVAAAPTTPPLPAPTTPPSVGGSGTVKSVTLAVNRNSPQAPGTAITFTAVATGGAAPHAYKWLVDDGSGFKPVTAWSSLDSFTWTPGNANPKYRVGVWARSNGNAKEEAEATVSIEFPIAAPGYAAVASVSFAADKPAPQAPGTTVTFTARGQGGTGPLQFKWLVHDGNSWAPVTGWSTLATFTWTPSVANPSYRIGVWVRGHGKTTDEPDATSSDDYGIRSASANTPRLTEVRLSFDAVAPQPMGRTINVTATPVGGAPGHTYRWLIHDGTKWNVVSGWSTSNRFAWTPAKADPHYRIGVWVRAGGNVSEDYEVSASQLFSIY